MIRDDTVKKLMQISTPKTFRTQEYIFHEGQLGTEMFIILQGTVGVYVSNALGTQSEVSRLSAGDFFGEMALFNDMPRSASCVALDTVICIVVRKHKLEDLIAACPQLAIKLMENMSKRIRKADDTLYKSDYFTQSKEVQDFIIPEAFVPCHTLEEPYQNNRITAPINDKCPVCGKEIQLLTIKKNMLGFSETEPDGRIRYIEYEPRWHNIWNCPHCGYSNHYLNFFKMEAKRKDFILRIINDYQNPEIDKLSQKINSPFDRMMINYLKAIHVTEACDLGSQVFIGKLWLSMYWLFDDANDEDMKKYCAEKVIEYLYPSIINNDIEDEYSYQSTALTLAKLCQYTDKNDKAAEMRDVASKGRNYQIRVYAEDMKL